MNVIELVGAVCQEPELKYTPNGLAILEITLAGKSERAWYHRVTLFGKPAEIHAETPVGTVVSVMGRLDYQTWERDGQKRSAVKVIADSLALTDGTVSADGKGQPFLDDAVNEAKLAGNLTRDPEVREAGNAEVCNAGMAVNERYKGEDKAHFFDLARWNALIPGAKGDRVHVVGELRTRSFEDRSGQRQYRTEVVVTRAAGGPQEAHRAPATDRLDIDADEDSLPF